MKFPNLFAAVAVCIGLVAVVAATNRADAAQEPGHELAIVARVGPWPIASKLIGYRGRLWFVNSVLGRNHNSADVYSYDPASRGIRYERHLFSQDSGDPITKFGLLYWPSEDSRWSVGRGDFLVTNGEHWAAGTVPTAQIFHIHAMTSLGTRLIAATSAWRGGIQVSDDRGATWREIYDHPTPTRQVSRIVTLASTTERSYGYLLHRDNRRLISISGDVVAEVPGWPQNRLILGMAGKGKWLYALVRESAGIAIWRTDGVVSHSVAAPRANWDAQDLVVSNDKLWVLTESAQGGAVWMSDDGGGWQQVAWLRGGSPYDLEVVDGAPFVGGTDGTHALIWGLTAAGESGPLPAIASLPVLLPPTSGAPEPAKRFAEALLRIESGGDRGVLSGLAYELARARPPAETYRALLALKMPAQAISLIGGNVKVPAATLGRWLILWSMSLARTGPVALEWIATPWSAPTNRSEKYFEAAPGAMWAAAATSQKDRGTLAALVRVLEQDQAPLWLKGDAVGALTALTSQRFGYDVAAWRRWLNSQ